MSKYHVPVLFQECLDGLEIKPDGIYVDVTFGGGGHAAGILGKLGKGRLIAFDKDAEAVENKLTAKNFELVHHDFIYMKNFLKELKAIPVDGILADLGVSWHQFDSETRGFSYRFDSSLDMRMDTDTVLTAAILINQYPEAELAGIFRSYGEIHNPAYLAGMIARERAVKEINTTFSLLKIIDKCVKPPLNRNKYAGQVFQALRIVVNDELNALKKLITQSAEILKKGGRLAIISYHSLEDRLVKNYFRSGNFEGNTEKDIYGNIQLPFRAVNRHPIVPAEEEISRNIRSRSAKLRIGEKM